MTRKPPARVPAQEFLCLHVTLCVECRRCVCVCCRYALLYVWLSYMYSYRCMRVCMVLCYVYVWYQYVRMYVVRQC